MSDEAKTDHGRFPGQGDSSLAAEHRAAAKQPDWPDDMWTFRDFINYLVSVACAFNSVGLLEMRASEPQPMVLTYLLWSLTWALWGIHSSKGRALPLIYSACLVCSLVAGWSMLSQFSKPLFSPPESGPTSSSNHGRA